MTHMVHQMGSNAIDGIMDSEEQEDLFHSNADEYPWLALDLGVGFLYKVPVYTRPEK